MPETLHPVQVEHTPITSKSRSPSGERKYRSMRGGESGNLYQSAPFPPSAPGKAKSGPAKQFRH